MIKFLEIPCRCPDSPDSVQSIPQRSGFVKVGQTMKLMLIIIFLSAFTTAEAADLRDHEGLRWRFIDNQRVQDGGTEAVYELSLPKFHQEVELLQFFYVVTPLKQEERHWIRQGVQEIYTKPLQGEHQTRRIKIYEGRVARIELWAGAKIGKKFYTARTILTSFGQSNKIDTQAQRLTTKPQWPNLELTQLRRNYYRAQAGTQLSFILNHENSNQAVTRLFENGQEIVTGLSRKPNGILNYTPPIDPLMAAPGFTVTRDLLLVSSTNDGENIMSYYLPVYRSFYGHSYLRPGLLVLATSVVISLGLVYYRGRRFKW